MNAEAANLKAAQELIRNPTHWTQGAMARDATGKQTTSDSPTAVMWCASGACEKFDTGRELCFLCDAALALYGLGEMGVNDCLGHAAVMRMFDEAIALAEA